jgi:ferredoxin
MPIVRVEPSGSVFDAEMDESLMFAAERHGYYWPTICGGHGSCRACVCSPVEGADNLSPVDDWEREGLDALGLVRPGFPSPRLACQARARGDVVVEKVGVKPRKR